VTSQKTLTLASDGCHEEIDGRKALNWHSSIMDNVASSQKHVRDSLYYWDSVTFLVSPKLVTLLSYPLTIVLLNRLKACSSKCHDVILRRTRIFGAMFSPCHWVTIKPKDPVTKIRLD
jgi:hypothetical protein